MLRSGLASQKLKLGSSSPSNLKLIFSHRLEQSTHRIFREKAIFIILFKNTNSSYTIAPNKWVKSSASFSKQNDIPQLTRIEIFSFVQYSGVEDAIATLVILELFSSFYSQKCACIAIVLKYSPDIRITISP